MSPFLNLRVSPNNQIVKSPFEKDYSCGPFGNSPFVMEVLF